jgi:hypothetical protein
MDVSLAKFCQDWPFTDQDKKVLVEENKVVDYASLMAKRSVIRQGKLPQVSTGATFSLQTLVEYLDAAGGSSATTHHGDDLLRGYSKEGFTDFLTQLDDPPTAATKAVSIEHKNSFISSTVSTLGDTGGVEYGATGRGYNGPVGNNSSSSHHHNHAAPDAPLDGLSPNDEAAEENPFFLSKQGFHLSQAYGSSNEDGLDEEDKAPARQEIEQDFVEYSGYQFRKGSCYNYFHQKWNEILIVGIKAFFQSDVVESGV